MGLSDRDVFSGPPGEGVAFIARERPLDHGGATGHKRTGGNPGFGENDGSGGHDAFLADVGSVHDRRGHTDQALVFDGAGMKDGSVATGDTVADEGWPGA